MIETRIISLPVPGGSQELMLRGDGTALCQLSGDLFVADLHLGKAETFQAQGYAVPTGGDAATFQQLQRAIHHSQSQRLVILGDVLHAPAALRHDRLGDLLKQLCTTAACPIVVVPGNHDRLPMQILHQAGIATVAEGKVYDKSHVGPSKHQGLLTRQSRWQLWHHPPISLGQASDRPDQDRHSCDTPWLAGHLHPVMDVQAPGQRRRVPCFALHQHGLILPAFGRFTGGYRVNQRSRRGSQQRQGACRPLGIWQGHFVT